MKSSILDLRRGMWACATSAFLLAGATLSGPAQAANTVTITGGSSGCTFTEVRFSPTLDYTFTCSGASSPGSIVFTPTSYAVNVTQATSVTVGRTGGSVGAVSVTVGTSAGCTITSGSPVNFADGDILNKTVTVTAGASPATCTLTFTSVTGGASATSSASVSVNDPNQPGTFSFASASSNASTGVTTHTVTVSRAGGTAGGYSVAFSEVLTGVTGYVTGSTSVAFGAGQATATIPVSNTGTAAGTATYTLGAVTPTTGGPATTASGTHTVNVTAVASGSCPPPMTGAQTMTSLRMQNFTDVALPAPSGVAVVVSGAPGSIISMPIIATAVRARVFNTAATPSAAGMAFSVAQCPGVIYDDWPQWGHVTTPVGGHIGGCKKTGGQAGNSLDITTFDPVFPPKCWITTAERAPTWYMTVRIDSCGTYQTCEFAVQVD